MGLLLQPKSAQKGSAEQPLILAVRAGGEFGDVALPMLQLVDHKKERVVS